VLSLGDDFPLSFREGISFDHFPVPLKSQIGCSRARVGIAPSRMGSVLSEASGLVLERRQIASTLPQQMGAPERRSRAMASRATRCRAPSWQEMHALLLGCH